jgi:hypothetical protein
MNPSATLQLSAHQFPQVYAALGYDLTKLGCIMLPIVQDDDLRRIVADTINPEDTYTSDNLSHTWINGIVTDTAHLTILYGLLRSGMELKQHVDTLLDDGKAVPNEILIADVGSFDSPYDDEPYYCLIAHAQLTDNLLAAHTRLTFLPHIDTFPGYEPHITLAYIKKDNAKRDGYVAALNEKLSGMILTTTRELDYGSSK